MAVKIFLRFAGQTPPPDSYCSGPGPSAGKTRRERGKCPNGGVDLLEDCRLARASRVRNLQEETRDKSDQNVPEPQEKTRREIEKCLHGGVDLLDDRMPARIQGS